MSKRKKIIILVLVLIAAAAVAYFIWKKRKAAPKAPGYTPPKPANTGGAQMVSDLSNGLDADLPGYRMGGGISYTPSPATTGAVAASNLAAPNTPKVYTVSAPATFYPNPPQPPVSGGTVSAEGGNTDLVDTGQSILVSNSNLTG